MCANERVCWYALPNVSFYLHLQQIPHVCTSQEHSIKHSHRTHTFLFLSFCLVLVQTESLVRAHKCDSSELSQHIATFRAHIIKDILGEKSTPMCDRCKKVSRPIKKDGSLRLLQQPVKDKRWRKYLEKTPVSISFGKKKQQEEEPQWGEGMDKSDKKKKKHEEDSDEESESEEEDEKTKARRKLKEKREKQEEEVGQKRKRSSKKDSDDDEEDEDEESDSDDDKSAKRGKNEAGAAVARGWGDAMSDMENVLKGDDKDADSKKKKQKKAESVKKLAKESAVSEDKLEAPVGDASMLST